jgi:hypothetical protein
VSDLTLSGPLVPSVPAAPRRVENEKARSVFRRATIQTRLTIAFLATGAMSLVVTLLAVWLLHAMEQDRLRDVRVARMAGELYAVAAASALAPASPAGGERAEQLLKALAERSPSPQGRALVAQAEAAR